jgi:hypothetical protein
VVKRIALALVLVGLVASPAEAKRKLSFRDARRSIEGVGWGVHSKTKQCHRLTSRKIDCYEDAWCHGEIDGDDSYIVDLSGWVTATRIGPKRVRVW